MGCEGCFFLGKKFQEKGREEGGGGGRRGRWEVEEDLEDCEGGQASAACWREQEEGNLTHL